MWTFITKICLHLSVCACLHAHMLHVRGGTVRICIPVLLPTCTLAQTCTHVHSHTYTHTQATICMHEHASTYTQASTWMNALTYAHMWMPKHAHTNKHSVTYKTNLHAATCIDTPTCTYVLLCRNTHNKVCSNLRTYGCIYNHTLRMIHTLKPMDVAVSIDLYACIILCTKLKQHIYTYALMLCSSMRQKIDPHHKRKNSHTHQHACISQQARIHAQIFRDKHAYMNMKTQNACTYTHEP